ncbi:hypothetical protein BT63DRAFT_468019 [Microthyrium microscopicum]|uniref:Uncharacterized protein n=1 Tax=Microthyrium microscopicum TaxID=703497 RepID=A0A6A6UJU7_9PEZI|nr:hypothetical protein BT63DRAFT_468019 [Microthyrium microscopicum]
MNGWSMTLVNTMTKTLVLFLRIGYLGIDNVEYKHEKTKKMFKSSALERWEARAIRGLHVLLPRACSDQSLGKNAYQNSTSCEAIFIDYDNSHTAQSSSATPESAQSTQLSSVTARTPRGAMPPALHPRSRTTLTLFTTTLALSFAVVGLPHILPCPVPHNKRMYADGEMPGRRRKRKPQEGETQSGKTGERNIQETIPERECPVPKPTGLVGQILGFEQKNKPLAPIVKVEAYTGRIPKESNSKNKES